MRRWSGKIYPWILETLQFPSFYQNKIAASQIDRGPLTELDDALVSSEAGEDWFAAGEGLLQQSRQRRVEERLVCSQVRV